MPITKMRADPGRKFLFVVSMLAITVVVFSQLSLKVQGRVIEFCTLGDWPLEWAVRRQFARNQAELRSILEFAIDAPEVSRLSYSAAGLHAILEQNQSETHDIGEPNILQALISIEAKFVKYEENEVTVFLGSEIRGPTHFEVSYVYHEYEVDLINCEGISARERAKIGFCGFSINPNWYISYQWYPDNADELNDALDQAG